MKDSLNTDSLEQIISIITSNAPDSLDSESLDKFIELNLSHELEDMITKLPVKFEAKRQLDLIHPGNINQVGIYFKGEISDKFNSKRISPIASIGLYFNDENGRDVLNITGIQGELTEDIRGYSRREVRRVFGKLNTFFEEDWRSWFM